ncbi:MAG: PIG-L family deacetylase [bacterium]|nr:PIG-L family deacetylase [bacterium]
MKKHFLILNLLLLLVQQLFPQVNGSSPCSSELLLSLKKLNTLGSVLYIAAHPDDENTRLLAYLANEKNYRTGYLSITRGDGGQNLIGKEQGELLGLIRTQELLAARRKDGAEQFFTRANDFGYSKNPEETFEIWNKDSILADAVLTIRKFKPDVIICRFPTTGEGGHGHHTASAILALEAFDAAADPNRFPEQLKFTDVWQSKRLFWNTFNFGTTNTTSPDQLKIDVGAFNPLLGKSYGEIASESRSMHKSQGFGSARQRGSMVEYFKLLKGDSVTSDLFESISTQWDKLKGGDVIRQAITSCIASFQADDPQKSIPALVGIYKQINTLAPTTNVDAQWKELKLKQVESLLVSFSGLWLEALSSEYSSVPGQTITYSVQAVNRNSGSVKLRGFSFNGEEDTLFSMDMKGNELYSFKRKRQLPTTINYSAPYWLSQKHVAGRYTVAEMTARGRPENEPALYVTFEVTILDLPLRVQRPLVYKYTDPVKGELYRPFEILPPATINISEKLFVFADLNPKEISCTVRANTSMVKGTLEMSVPKGWKLQFEDNEFDLPAKGDEFIMTATLTPQKSTVTGVLQASLIIDQLSYNKSIERIEYDHLPSQFVLKEAEAKLLKLDLKKGNTHIAYIPGAGDEVANCLKQIGYGVTVLSDEQIKHEDLSRYSAIVTGVRAYNTNEHLQVYHALLMNYVKRGGNLIVQYNTNSRVGPLQAKIGPYPFTISRERVTNENAPVQFKNEKHPLLLYPNKISESEFKDWVQERGIYFATDLDKNYETIFAMSDPNEKSLEGSLILCKYGSGNFVYTGLAFFRELPAGVQGAYPLFVNLLSLKKNKK